MQHKVAIAKLELVFKKGSEDQVYTTAITDFEKGVFAHLRTSRLAIFLGRKMSTRSYIHG